MVNCAFDTSALVKLVVHEEGTLAVLELWRGAGFVAASRLAYPETRAALAAAARGGRLTTPQLADATRRAERLWSDLRVVEMTGGLARLAGELAPQYALSGTDAVHLASALALRDAGTLLVTFDHQLANAARLAGMGVAPELRSG